MPKRGGSDGTAARGKRRRGPAARAENADEGEQPQEVNRLAQNQLDPSLLASYTAAAVHANTADRSNADDSEGGEGEEGSDGGEGERAEEAPNASGPPDLQATAQQLVTLTGIPLETAVNALRETQDDVFKGSGGGSAGGSSGPSGAALQQAWLEEAQIWLACNMELQEEIQHVGIAMRESLQESEAAKKAEEQLPLAERSPDALRDRFAPPPGSAAALVGAPRSAVFARLAEVACHQALFGGCGGGGGEGAEGGGEGGEAAGAGAASVEGGAGPAGAHKAGLVKLMELECKCRKWFPRKGTSRFFEQLAEDCVTAAAEAAAVAAPQAPALPQQAWLDCAQGPGECAICAAALGQGAGADAGAAGPSAAPAAPRVALPPPAAAAALRVVAALASRRADEINTVVCKMPDFSGQVPGIFTALEDAPGAEGGGDGADDVEDLIEVVETRPPPAAEAARQQAVEL